MNKYEFTLEDYKKILKDAESMFKEGSTTAEVAKGIIKMAAHEIKKFDDVKVESKVSST